MPPVDIPKHNNFFCWGNYAIAKYAQVRPISSGGATMPPQGFLKYDQFHSLEWGNYAITKYA